MMSGFDDEEGMYHEHYSDYKSGLESEADHD